MKYIKRELEVDLKAKLKFTTEKGTNEINDLTIGGEHEAGYLAGLAHYTRYRVEKGYTYPLLEDGTVGEKTYFVAKEPLEIWLDWKKAGSFDPRTAESENE